MFFPNAVIFASEALGPGQKSRDTNYMRNMRYRGWEIKFRCLFIYKGVGISDAFCTKKNTKTRRRAIYLHFDYCD